MYDHVIWPLPFDPKTSAIYALNDIDVNAQPEVVCKLLVDAENWSSYFPAEDQVKILTGEPGGEFFRFSPNLNRAPHRFRGCRTLCAFPFCKGCGFRRRAPNPFRSAGSPQYVDNTYMHT